MSNLIITILLLSIYNLLGGNTSDGFAVWILSVAAIIDIFRILIALR
jgi:hypothetical protein